MLDLKTALGLKSNSCIAFVGAGGKTTALFQLAREYRSPVLMANTAHMEFWQLALADSHFYQPDLQAYQQMHPFQGVTLITGTRNSRSVFGLSPDNIRNVWALAQENRMPLLIEADGSRRHPIKAPADHEPPIPDFVDTVVVTVGLSALGHPISTEWVHRPEIFSDLSQQPQGSLISTELIRRVLSHSNGGLKNIPPGARRIVLLNQADTQELRVQASHLASALFPTYQAVLVTALKNENRIENASDPVEEVQPKIYSFYEPAGGIILAAGASTRMV